eukprot:6202653-Pleurochrysis_carterae.AAC.4
MLASRSRRSNSSNGDAAQRGVERLRAILKVGETPCGKSELIKELRLRPSPVPVVDKRACVDRVAPTYQNKADSTDHLQVVLAYTWAC